MVALLASAATAQLSAMNCTLRVEMTAADFDLSSEAEAGIRFKEGTEQNETAFQSLECECIEKSRADNKSKSASANLIKSRVKAQRKLLGVRLKLLHIRRTAFFEFSFHRHFGGVHLALP